MSMTVALVLNGCEAHSDYRRSGLSVQFIVSLQPSATSYRTRLSSRRIRPFRWV